MVSDTAYNIWPFFTFQVRDKERLALQTTYKTRLRIPRRSVWDNRQHFSTCLENACCMYRGPCIDVHERVNKGEHCA